MRRFAIGRVGREDWITIGDGICAIGWPWYSRSGTTNHHFVTFLLSWYLYEHSKEIADTLFIYF